MPLGGMHWDAQLPSKERTNQREAAPAKLPRPDGPIALS